MPDYPRTLDAILAMDDETLNVSIDTHCTTHHWEQQALIDGRVLWLLDHPDVPGRLWSSVPHLHYTASYDKTMDLRDTHGQYIDLVWSGTVQIVRSSYGAMPALTCTTPEEVRRAICQLVLWQTGERQRWTVEEARHADREAAEANRLAHGEVPRVFN